MPLISHHALLSSSLLDGVTRRFGAPFVAALPPVSLHEDPTESFARLLGALHEADVALFTDTWPGDLDGFFRLRLAQVLAGRPPLPGLSVVVLTAEMAGPRLAGGFADRFRFGWPFARCVFLTEDDNRDALSSLLGLPVGGLDDHTTVLSEAVGGQAVAVQIQPAWGRCGSTILFENQVESLVRAGFLTIRVFADAQWRRGVTLRSRMERAAPENSVHAGAHIDVIAVPDGPPSGTVAEDADATWRRVLTATVSCRIRDDAVVQAAGLATCAIANRLESIGPALVFSPNARLLLSLQEDRAAAIHAFAVYDGRGDAAASIFAHSADRVQAALLGIPDICGFVSSAEMDRLAPHCRRAVTVRPNAYAVPSPDGVTPRFDLLLTGAEDAMNIASLRWFLKQVWRPHLEAHAVSVAIAGRAGLHVRDAGLESPLLHFFGFVDDLEAVRSLCRLTVVPDIGQAGVSAKMLTTLAAGHPVATTRPGLRGLDPSVAGFLPAHDAADTLAADILDLLRSPARLDQRRHMVQQIRDAGMLGANHAELVMAVPQPTGPGIRKRRDRWSRLAGPVPPADAAVYRFLPDVVFPMSGGRWDQQVLLDGWHDAEPWGRWTDGVRASLRIALAAPEEEMLTLELDLVPSPAGANLLIDWDGTMLQLIDPVAGPNLWDVPPDLTAGKTSFVVSLHVGGQVHPAAGGSVDDRILGIGVRAVRLLSRPATVCEPAVFMPVNAASMPHKVLSAGWQAPEFWGCWTSQTTASLRLTLSEPLQGRFQLELDIALPSAGTMLTLSVNGVALPAIAPADGINRWEMPVRVTNGRTELRILLSVPETFCAARAGSGMDDRELGIGLRGIRLAPFVPAFYEPGTRLRLVRTALLEQILPRGWHPPEDWGCWTNGRDAAVRLMFHQPLLGRFRLEMDMAPVQVATHLTVSVNGQALSAIVPRGGSQNWTLPERLTDEQRELEITLRVADTFRPADIADSADDRILGVGVRWLKLHREAAPVCPIGGVVRLSSDLGDSGVLVAGWHKAEPWGCWSSGPDASMLLRFDAPLAGNYVLALNMQPPLLNGPVILSVNGDLLDAVAVADGLNEWVLPRTRTEGRTELDLHLLVALPVRPIDVADSRDDRILGVAVRSFEIRAIGGT